MINLKTGKKYLTASGRIIKITEYKFVGENPYRDYTGFYIGEWKSYFYPLAKDPVPRTIFFVFYKDTSLQAFFVGTDRPNPDLDIVAGPLTEAEELAILALTDNNGNDRSLDLSPIL